jgi:ABC-type transport system involved in multi-copper enzyme maturation permease subunit
MGIRETGYRHWQGTYTSNTFRWWTIAKQALRATVFSKGRLFGTLLLIFLIWAPAFFFGLFWFLAGQSEFRGGESFIFGTADKALRLNLYQLFQGWQVFIVPIYAGALAAPFVSNDLRSNALYIYLAKPLRRGDYILGKLVAAVLWCIPVTFLPAMFVWMMAIASADKSTQIRDSAEIFFEIITIETLLLVVVVSVVLALSSLTKRWWIAFSGFLGAYYLLWVLSTVLQEVTTKRFVPESGRQWLLASVLTNLINVAREVFEQTSRPPDWTGSFWILMLVTGGALGLFLWRIYKLEVAE